MFSESEWFFFLFPGEFFLKIKFNSFFFAICETQWKRKFRIFFFTLKTKFLRGKIKSPERKGKRMFSNAWKRMKKNLEKIICETEWNRRFEGSHIFPGNCIFLSHVWKQMKKKIPTKFLLREKRFWQEFQILLGIVSFSRRNFLFFFSVWNRVKRMVWAGEPHFFQVNGKKNYSGEMLLFIGEK